MMPDKMVAPSLVYHYCTLAALKGIVENKSIWLTNLFYMNDNMEHFWLRNIAATFLEQKIPATSISILDSPDERKEKLRYLLTAMRNEVSQKTLDDVFCTSFSTLPDALSQWRAYADDGYGFAIGFASQTFAGLTNINLQSVIYDQLRHEQIVQHWFDAALSDFERFVAGEAGQNDLDTLAFYFRFHIWNAAAYCKNPAFEEEHEWRLIYASDIVREATGGIVAVDPKAPSPLQFRQRGRDLVPYFILSFDPAQRPIRQIVIGPKNNAPEQEYALQSWLSRNDIWDVEIIRSKASYR